MVVKLFGTNISHQELRNLELHTQWH